MGIFDTIIARIEINSYVKRGDLAAAARVCERMEWWSDAQSMYRKLGEKYLAEARDTKRHNHDRKSAYREAYKYLKWKAIAAEHCILASNAEVYSEYYKAQWMLDNALLAEIREKLMGSNSAEAARLLITFWLKWGGKHVHASDLHDLVSTLRISLLEKGKLMQFAAEQEGYSLYEVTYCYKYAAQLFLAATNTVMWLDCIIRHHQRLKVSDGNDWDLECDEIQQVLNTGQDKLGYYFRSLMVPFLSDPRRIYNGCLQTDATVWTEFSRALVDCIGQNEITDVDRIRAYATDVLPKGMGLNQEVTLQLAAMLGLSEFEMARLRKRSEGND